MSFHYPSSFWFMIVWGGLITLLLWSRWKRRRDLDRLGDTKLIVQLIPIDALKRRRKKDVLNLIGLFILILALTGPLWGPQLKEIRQRGVNVFIAIDTSRSMMAEDVPPSRLEKTKQSLSYLIRKLEGHRIGLIAFARFAIIQCPLTVDNNAVRMFLNILDTDAVPLQGTSLGDAIRLAIKSFPDDDSSKVLVLLTDGEDHLSNPTEAAKLAQEKNITIYTIGIGTTKGDVIKNRDSGGNVTEFHKHKGEMVISRLDDALLTKLATLTGGHYYRSSSTDNEIDEIADLINGMEKKEFSSKSYRRLKERFQIFALLAFILLLMEFFISERTQQWARIKKEFEKIKLPKWKTGQKMLPFLLAFSVTTSLMAETTNHLKKATKYLKKKDWIGARGEFESARIDQPEEAYLPYNIGNTYYAEGNLEEAKRSYEQAYQMAKNQELKSMVAYNWAHALFYTGEKEGALKKFKECLKINPKDQNAKYNIEYILSGKNPPPHQNQNQDGDGESNENNKQNQSDKDKSNAAEDKNNEAESEPEEKKGDLSKEEAERILEMIQDQENQNRRDMKIIHGGKEDQEKNANVGEDW